MRAAELMQRADILLAPSHRRSRPLRISEKSNTSGDDANENVRARRSMSAGLQTHTPEPKAVTVLPRPRGTSTKVHTGNIIQGQFGEAEQVYMTKRTPKTIEVLLEYIRAGNYVSVACRAAGIHPSTLKNWMDDDPELGAAMAQAKAEFETRAIDKINGADSWQAQAWKLERRAPNRWGRTDRKVVTGPDGGPVQHQVAVLMVDASTYSKAKALSEGSGITTTALADRPTSIDLDAEDDSEMEELT